MPHATPTVPATAPDCSMSGLSSWRKKIRNMTHRPAARITVPSPPGQVEGAALAAGEQQDEDRHGDEEDRRLDERVDAEGAARHGFRGRAPVDREARGHLVPRQEHRQQHRERRDRGQALVGVQRAPGAADAGREGSSAADSTRRGRAAPLRRSGCPGGPRRARARAARRPASSCSTHQSMSARRSSRTWRMTSRELGLQLGRDELAQRLQQRDERLGLLLARRAVLRRRPALRRHAAAGRRARRPLRPRRPAARPPPASR